MAEEETPQTQLAELHKKGVLSDSEFDLAKRKLLDQNWSKD
jgi:hypothetical protein